MCIYNFIQCSVSSFKGLLALKTGYSGLLAAFGESVNCNCPAGCPKMGSDDDCQTVCLIFDTWLRFWGLVALISTLLTVC